MKASETVDALLEARGSTKKWLAGKIGLKESAFSRYLAGNRPAPPDLYQRVADVLQVPVSLFESDESEIRPPAEGAAA
jgi:transcriptional regulator with XRE-family HTH domain